MAKLTKQELDLLATNIREGLIQDFKVGKEYGDQFTEEYRKVRELESITSERESFVIKLRSLGEEIKKIENLYGIFYAKNKDALMSLQSIKAHNRPVEHFDEDDEVEERMKLVLQLAIPSVEVIKDDLILQNINGKDAYKRVVKSKHNL